MRRPVILACLLAAFAAGCGDNESDVASRGETEEQRTEARTETAPPKREDGCQKVKQPKPKKVDEKRPTERLDRDKSYKAVVRTTCGTFTIQLATRQSPKTTASFVSLARKNVYDQLTFHRIVPDFVVQGGSPDGGPSGEPGYRVKEAPPEDASYPPYTVAMAKTELEDPGTSGSQFFVVISDLAELEPLYAILGTVTEGREVVQRIGSVQTDPQKDDAPKEPVVIQDVRIEEEERRS